MRRLALVVLVALACTREPQRPAVILLSIDTLRADRLARMPNLQRFASDAISFDSAWSHVPLTLPSHTSILTGLLPPEHGVRDNAGFRVDAKTPTIASTLRANGYATGAAVSAYVLRRDTGIANGFDSFDDAIEFVEGAPTGALQRRGEETIARALAWLDGSRDQPPFLFVHLFEPHTPYAGSYDADVLRADRLAGEFLDALRTRGLYDDALIVVLSDHGEGLGDHGEKEHGILLYREELQVPLLIKLPHNTRRGEHVRDAVQLIDVLPTIAKITHSAAPQNVRGRSLLEPHDSPIYSETLYPRIHLGWSDLRSIVHAAHHLIAGPKPELYALRDTHETHDLHAEERRAFAQLRHDLDEVPQREAAPQLNAEEAKKLAALGYLTAHATQHNDKNPREHLHELQAREEITLLMHRGDFASAAKKLETLLLTNPGWSDLRDDLGVAYERQGRLADAERAYREAIRATPELAHDVALSLAGVLLREGKLDDAEQHARIAERSTQPKAARLMRAEIRALRHDPAGALAILQSIDAPYPPRYHFVRADTLGSLGSTDEAIRAFEESLRIDPRDEDAYVRLALLYRVRGDRLSSDRTLARMTRALPQSAPLASRLRREWFGLR